MIQQLKNIESAFKHIRMFTAVLILACLGTCCYTIFTCLRLVNEAQQRVYIISNDKAIAAFAGNRKDNIPVEVRDHIKVFHELFFSLSPDEKAIEANIGKALYMADISAQTQYNDLKEKGYYSSVISGNVSQQVSCDSVVLQTVQHPYYFRYYGKQHIIRPSAIVTRSLITEGYVRDLHERTDNNPHGFLIERWQTIANMDLQSTKR